MAGFLRELSVDSVRRRRGILSLPARRTGQAEQKKSTGRACRCSLSLL